ncbi:hypothetical protein ASPCADRAFT_210746, partial [Aspergillus carbonarius ITEM 5010]
MKNPEKSIEELFFQLKMFRPYWQHWRETHPHESVEEESDAMDISPPEMDAAMEGTLAPVRALKRNRSWLEDTPAEAPVPKRHYMGLV